jgi:hypothetical protein
VGHEAWLGMESQAHTGSHSALGSNNITASMPAVNQVTALGDVTERVKCVERGGRIRSIYPCKDMDVPLTNHRLC